MTTYHRYRWAVADIVVVAAAADVVVVVVAGKGEEV